MIWLLYVHDMFTKSAPWALLLFVAILIVLIVIPVYHFICSTTVFTKTAKSHFKHKLYYI